VTPTTLAIGILALAGLALVAFLILNSTRQRRAIEDVPPGMRPGYSDEELERSVLERYMAWGVVLTLFFAIFFPVYWWYESRRLPAEEQTFFVQSVVHGEEEYQQLCALCHGADAQGGATAAPDGEGQWPVPALNNIVARYEDNPNIVDIEDFIISTIERGRPGTPMPTFGQAFGGPLTDQQVEDLTAWILANQVEADEEGEEVAEASDAAGQSGEELYQENCMKCHGAELQGGVAPSLVGVFDRHSEEQILAILRHGIIVPTGAIMPAWQEGYMYEDARYTDEALQRIVDYLRENQDTDGERDPQSDAPPEADIPGGADDRDGAETEDTDDETTTDA
jgi:mono/diheme cytochrome c family protein